MRATFTFALAALACLAACSSERAPWDVAPVDAGVDASESGAEVGDARPDSAVDAADAADAADATDVTADAFEASDGAPTPRVLFVGNSYTYVNDLPALVRAIAASGSLVVDVDSVTVGGATLRMHYESTGALPKIRGGKWSHVVLQGQSVEPLYAPGDFQTYAKLLADEAKAVGALPVFYETWARMAGDAVYAETWSGGTPAAMQAGLRSAYENAAKASGGVVARVGDAREKALAAGVTFTLFQADGSHPSVHGTYLGACVFHRTLTGRPSTGLGAVPAGVTTAEAATLQSIADAL